MRAAAHTPGAGLGRRAHVLQVEIAHGLTGGGEHGRGARFGRNGAAEQGSGGANAARMAMITAFARRVQIAAAMAMIAPPPTTVMTAWWLLRLTWRSGPARQCSAGAALQAVAPGALPQPTRPLGLLALLQP